MMTEKEASERWCPMVRVVIGPDTESWQENMFDNRGDVVTVNGLRCIGSRCMAWRQTDNKTWPTTPGQTERTSEPAGYCGLAGKNG